MAAEAGSAVFRAKSEMGAVFRDMGRIRTDAAKTATAVSGMSAGMSRGLASAGASMTTAGRKMSLGLTLPIVAAGAVAVKAFVGFEEAITSTKLVAGATASEFADLRNEALRLGEVTRFSPQSAAEGMYELASAGLEVDQIMGSIEPTLNFATAASLGLGEASGLVAESMNAFGLEAEDSTRIGDVLTAMLQSSTFHAEELSQAFAHAGQLGATANQSYESVAAGLSIIRSQGVPAAQAGVALRQAFDNLKAPSDGARGAMESLGISVRDSAGEMLQFPQIVQQFQGALDDTNPAFMQMRSDMGYSQTEMRDFVGATVFGTAGMKAMGLALNATTTLMHDGAEGTAQLTALYGTEYVAALEKGAEVTIEAGDAVQLLSDKYQNAGGTAEKFAAEMRNTVGGQITELKGSLETLAIVLIDTIAPVLQSILQDYVIPAVNGFKRFAEAHPGLVKLGVGLLAAAAAAGPFLLILGGLFKGLAPILGIVSKVSGALGAGSGLAGAFPVLGKAVTLFTGPVGWIIGLLATLLAISPELREALGDLFKKLMPVLKKLVETLMPVLMDLWDALQPALLAIADALAVLIEALAPVIAALLDALIPVLEVVIAVLVEVIKVIAPIIEWLALLIKAIVDFVTGAEGSLAPFGEFFVNLFSGFMEIVGNVIEWLKANWPKIIAILAGPLGWAALAFSNWKEEIIGFMTNLKDRLVGVVAGLWNVVKSIWSTGLNNVKAITNVFKTGVLFVWNTIKTGIKVTIDFIKGLFDGLVAGVRNVWEAFGRMKDKVIGFVNGLKDKIMGPLNAVKGALNAINPFSRGSPSLVEYVEMGVEDIGDSYGEVKDIEVDGPRIKSTIEGAVMSLEDASTAGDVQDVRLVEIKRSVLPIETSGGGDSYSDGGLGSSGESLDDAAGSLEDAAAASGSSDGGGVSGGGGGGGSATAEDVIAGAAETFDSAAQTIRADAGFLGDANPPAERMSGGGVRRGDDSVEGKARAAIAEARELERKQREAQNKAMDQVFGVTVDQWNDLYDGQKQVVIDQAAQRGVIDDVRTAATALADWMTGGLFDPKVEGDRAKGVPVLSAPTPMSSKAAGDDALTRGDTIVVNNPKSQETGDSLRKISLKRNYLGANAGGTPVVRKIRASELLDDGRRRSGR